MPNVFGLATAPLGDLLVLVGGVFAILGVGSLIARWRAASAAGRLILDVGPHPDRTILLLYAALWTLLFAGVGLLQWWGGNVWGLLNVVAGALVATHVLGLALGRLQIRENGVWEYGRLRGWTGIRSHTWDDNVLLLDFSGDPVGTEVEVPAESVATIDELLRVQCDVLPQA